MASMVSATSVDVPSDLIDAIRTFPTERVVQHCGAAWSVSPFDIYTRCPQCGVQIKLRSFSAGAETEDVFDAVFEWMNQSGADALVQSRRNAIREGE
jgi:hypothetical protein